MDAVTKPEARPTTLKVEYDLTEPLAFALGDFYVLHDPGIRIAAMRYRCFTSFGWLAIAVFYAMHGQLLPGLALVALAVAWFVLAGRSYVRDIRTRTRRDLHRLRSRYPFHCSVAVSPRFLETTRPHSRSRYRWAGVADVRAQNDILFFTIDPHTIIAVPKDAFSTEAEYTEFAEASIQYFSTRGQPTEGETEDQFAQWPEPAARKLELEYELTVDQMTAFALYDIRRIPVLARRMNMHLWSGGAYILLLSLFMAGVAQNWRVAVPGGVLAVLYMLFFSTLHAWSVKYGYRSGVQGATALLPRMVRIAISPNGIQWCSCWGDTRMTWRGVLNVHKSPACVAFYVDSRSTLVVPPGAFESPDEYKHFAERAVTYMSSANLAAHSE